MNSFTEKLRQELPAIFGPKIIGALKILSERTLANYRSSGIGPPFYRIGNRVFYERDPFIDWLNKKSEKIETM